MKLVLISLALTLLAAATARAEIRTVRADGSKAAHLYNELTRIIEPACDNSKCAVAIDSSACSHTHVIVDVKVCMIGRLIDGRIVMNQIQGGSAGRLLNAFGDIIGLRCAGVEGSYGCATATNAALCRMWGPWYNRQ